MIFTDGKPLSDEPVNTMKLLIVEPDRLTRWSMQQYLQDLATVIAADSVESAHELLDVGPVDAVAIADDLPAHGADEIESHARTCNPNVRAVRMVTQPCSATPQSSNVTTLEKPFELARLAEVLGIVHS